MLAVVLPMCVPSISKADCGYSRVMIPAPLLDHPQHLATPCEANLPASQCTIQIQTHLPELLAGILAAYSLQDLGSTRVLLHESIHLVHIIVNDDVQALVDASSLLDIVGGEFLGHDDGGARSAFQDPVVVCMYAVPGGCMRRTRFCTCLGWRLFMSLCLYMLRLLPRMGVLVIENSNGDVLSGGDDNSKAANDQAEAQQKPRSAFGSSLGLITFCGRP